MKALREHLGVFITSALLGVVGGLALSAVLFGNDPTDTDPEYHPGSRPTAVEVGPAMVQGHDCWVHEAPPGVSIPGHVVVTTPEGRTVYGGPRLTGLALEQVFDHIDHGLTVWGFCR